MVRKTPLSGAERQRRYRQKLREENPEKLLQQERQNLERTKKKYKKISILTETEQKLQREKWRKEKQKNKDEKKCDKRTEDKTEKARQRMYSRKLQKENISLKSTVTLLVKKVKTLNRKNNRYKHKINQLTQKIRMMNNTGKNEQVIETNENKDTPYSKAEKIMNETIPVLSTPEKNKVVKKILFENIILKQSLQTQYSQATNNSERHILKKVVNNDMTSKYKMKTKLSTCVGLKGRLRSRQRLNNYKMKCLEELTSFYIRDDNSRATAGKSEYRTLHKIRKQVRYLLDTLKNLHKKYKNEGGKLSYATFTRYKPFYVLSPKIVDRNTCACVKHANLSFMVNKLKQLHLLKTDNFTELLSTIACNINDKKCMYNECQLCSSKIFEFELSQLNPTNTVSWKRWVTKQIKYSKNLSGNQQSEEKITKRTVKEETTGSLQTLQQTFCTHLRVFKKHHFNLLHQFKMYTMCKNKLTEREIVVHCDFSENYICKFTEEVQAMHFGASKRQISLHTGVIYANNKYGPKTISFCTISQNTNHTPGAIWAHLTPVLKLVKETFPSVKIIHFFTDGPTSQYRQKKNFYMINTAIPQLGFDKATWSYFEASHGKGAADGIGGATKRNLDGLVVHGHDIPDAEAAFKALVTNTTSKIKYFLVPDKDIDTSIKMLDAISKTLVAVPDTMSLHQIASTPNTGIIKFRKLSCFCGEDFGFCDCFDLMEHNLIQKRKIINEEIKVNKRRRLTSKKQEESDDTTDTDSNITYAESDESMDEIGKLDSDNIEDNEESIMILKDNTVDGKCRGDSAIDITQEGNIFTGRTNIKETNKVTLLSDIKFSPENKAFLNLQAYGPFKKIDINTNLFSTNSLKENVKNIYDNPVPSTSAMKENESKDFKIEEEQTGIDKYYTDLRHSNLEILKRQEANNNDIAKTFEEKKETNAVKLNKKTRNEKRETKEKKIDIKEIGNNSEKIIKKKMEDEIISNDMALTNTGPENNKKNRDTETEENDGAEIQKSKNENEGLQEKIKEKSRLYGCDDFMSLLNVINESVLVRYFEKNKWIYYIGFIESVQNDCYYNIKFLKTVRKPKLRFIFPKKDDKDTVPKINVVKKVELKFQSNEYSLCDESDSVYFT